IAGILHWGSVADAAQRSRPMARSIRHRGPDDEGFWADHDVALGFVRLSILDIAGGAQPMSNETGQVRVIFNGEIYNHRELRRELESRGHRFKSDHADTEVLVHGWEEWGAKLPEKLNGMFAFAVWDARERSLFLARDRYGIKPLYVARQGATLLFASEIRAIHASGLVERREDCDGVLEYLSQQNLWRENTMFAGVENFPAATWELIGSGGTRRQRYWDYQFTRSSKLDLPEAAEAHRAILSRVVARQIAADVPVVSYLSGGIDSSALTAAAFHDDPQVRAYSCLFDLTGVGDDRGVDEREYSRAVARHLGIEHTELELAPDALATSLDQTVGALETPRMGMSYVNYLIARRVSADSRVVLSGTGGDEIHGGYLYRYQAVAPTPNLPLLSRTRLRRTVGRWLGRPQHRASEIYRDMLNFPLHRAHLRNALTPEFLSRVTAYDAQDSIDRMLGECPYTNELDRVMYVDAKTYLPGLLVLEDKLSMAHSLETRVPLLDNELVDFVSDLPWNLLYDGTTGKIVFRESVKSWVPEAIYRKPKIGFGPPDASWYRSALRPFIEQQLTESKVRQRGIFLPEFVSRTLDDHFASRANNLAMIWSLLSLESWCRNFDVLGGDLTTSHV
ncbi:MAG: asparagine synthase (glutamine-hydrolyzing), partial [Burkholderiales bacterium]